MDRRTVIQHGLAGAASLVLAPDLARAAMRGGVSSPALHRDRPYLDVAVRASRWLERTAQRRGETILWSADPDRPAEVGYDLYNGTTGVLPFWVELYSATNEPRALEFVHGGAEHLLQALRSVDQKDAGLYTGLAGIGFALGLAHRVTRDDAHREGALRALALVREAAAGADVGMTAATIDAWVRWLDSTDIISGSAGTGLYLLWAYRQYGNDAALALARGAGNALIADAERVTEGQLRWKVNATIPREYPNFSHGTAGVSYFLAKLHEATKDARFLEAAVSGARYLQAIATRTEHDGRMVHHSTPGNETLFYMSWCHGPAGTARLFHTLERLTLDRSYGAYAEQLATATMDMKVPERSPGF